MTKSTVWNDGTVATEEFTRATGQAPGAIEGGTVVT